MATATLPGNGTYHANGHAAGPSIDRLPPMNIEAEQGVLGSMILDNRVIDDVMAVIKPGDFFRNDHEVLCKTIVKLFDAGKPVDALTLADQLKTDGQFDRVGGLDFLGDIVNATPHALNAVHYADIVRQKSLKRKLIESGNRLAALGYSDNTTAEEAIGLATESFSIVETAAHPDMTEDELGRFTERPWPAPPSGEIWHGIAGELVRMIDPHTESDPVAILVQFLVGFGNMVGRGPHFYAESTRHGLNLFATIVGDSSRARKGTSLDNAMRSLRECDQDWAENNVHRGLSSGEGMVYPIRDPVFKRERTDGPQLAGVGDGKFREVEVDPGVFDKRALWVETEFGSVLAHFRREGNILNAFLRQAFDGQKLGACTKKDPSRATNPHVSLIGHITFRELCEKLTQNDVSNGLANRFLWICVRRSKLLPRGGRIRTVDFTKLHQAIQWAAEAARLAYDDGVPLMLDREAGDIWDSQYAKLTAGRDDTVGEVTSRAEAIVMRLACIYAVLDGSRYIQAVHLNASLALWDYSTRCAELIFGSSVSNPSERKILEALRRTPEGLNRTSLNRRAFSGHMDSDELSKLIVKLEAKGSIVRKLGAFNGRTSPFWVIS